MENYSSETTSPKVVSLNPPCVSKSGVICGSFLYSLSPTFRQNLLCIFKSTPRVVTRNLTELYENLGQNLTE